MKKITPDMINTIMEVLIHSTITEIRLTAHIRLLMTQLSRILRETTYLRGIRCRPDLIMTIMNITHIIRTTILAK